MKKSITKLKKEAWIAFSGYIRRRTADWRGFVACVTCGVVKHWKEMQAGHFIPGRHNSILFDKRGCHVQCYRCNVPMKGNPRAYDAFMRKTYGVKVIKELEKLDRQSKSFTPQELIDLKDFYDKECEAFDN